MRKPIVKQKLEWKISNRDYVKDDEDGRTVNNVDICSGCGCTILFSNNPNPLCLPCKDKDNKKALYEIDFNEESRSKITWTEKYQCGTIKSATKNGTRLCVCCEESPDDCHCDFCDYCDGCFHHSGCDCSFCDHCEYNIDAGDCNCTFCEICGENQNSSDCMCWECENCNANNEDGKDCVNGCKICENCGEYECECVHCKTCNYIMDKDEETCCCEEGKGFIVRP